MPDTIYLMTILRYGIENNLALQQKRENYQMSLELLREARGQA